MGHGKVAIIGAGSVGSTVAYSLLMRNIAAEILLVDISSDILQGQVLDLTEATWDSPTVVRAGTFKEAAQADVIVMAAHSPWTEDLLESEWIKRNQCLMQTILVALSPICPEAVLIVGTEPVDILTFHIQQETNIPRHQVFGVGSSTRRTGLARAWAAGMVGSSNIGGDSGYNNRISNSNSAGRGAPPLWNRLNMQLFVVGNEMIPIVAWDSASINGEPLSAIPGLVSNRAILEHIVSTDRTTEIGKLKGGAWFGQAAMLTRVIEAVLNGDTEYERQSQSEPSTTHREQEDKSSAVYVLSTYVDQFETCVSVPVVVSRNGIERQVPLTLSPDEEHALERAADHTRCLYHDNIQNRHSI